MERPRPIDDDSQLTYFVNQSVPLIGADHVWNELGRDGSRR